MPHCGFRAATLFSKNCQVLYLKIELQSKELNCVKAQTKETKTKIQTITLLATTVFPHLWSPLNWGADKSRQFNVCPHGRRDHLLFPLPSPSPLQLVTWLL